MASYRDLANAIRALSMDAVQKANSGHPGMPMGMADIAAVLWNDFLKHNPADPRWINRDRFVVSNGHGSMLLYALLHLSGYDLSIDDLKNFRQLHSKTPGHPESHLTPGVETTTGPLGQGLANAVGLALAERTLASQFNRPNHEVINHFTYVFAGDGCLMEGISHEACSLAGTQHLGKLIVFWDDNSISIDGDVKGWFTDDTPGRFEAYGWQVIRDVDGHDTQAINKAIKEAQGDNNRPTLICCRTVIGYGAPNVAGSHKTHGAPLGDEEIAATRQAINWPHGAFEIPADIKKAWDATATGQQRQSEWQVAYSAYQAAHPELAGELRRRLDNTMPETWQADVDNYIAQCQQQGGDLATRKASKNCLGVYGEMLPEMLGGSADLTDSNLTAWQGSKAITPASTDGNYLHYGVREFGMAAIMNGMALYGGFIPYGGTFLVFSDYARNAIRMSALMGQQAIYVLTHDSIGLGEDGPTHQPIEHASSLRLIPNLSVWRPADDVETAVAWRHALENHQGPTSLLLTRQTVPHISRKPEQVQAIARGGYVVVDCQGEPDLIMIGTGSELQLAIEAAKQLSVEDIAVRVVSMPSTDVFDQQDLSYQQKVLPKQVTKRIAIEAGSPDLWYKYVGLEGKVIGIDRFGESAPAKEIFTYLGLTVENLHQQAAALIEETVE